MGKPFKMKYTNGKKADRTAFPFKVEAPEPGSSPSKEIDLDSAGGGAIKGAKAGAMFGPWGMFIGGAIGGIAGAVQGGKAKEEEEKRLKEEENKLVALNRQKRNSSMNTEGSTEQIKAGNNLLKKPNNVASKPITTQQLT